MTYFKNPSRKYLAVAGIFALSFMYTGCINKSDIDQFVDRNKSNDNGGVLNVSVTKPVDRDYADIKRSGMLRMITRYSSNTYFLHQGVEWGFEYELVRKFAQQHDLALEVVIIGPNDNPYDMLNSGKGDLIAANYTATSVRKKYVDFTRPYNIVNEVMVFSSDINDPPKTLKEVAKRGIPITVRRNSSYYHRLKELRKKGLNLAIHLVPNTMDTESLLFEISSNKYSATVADDNIFQASNKYMNGLTRGPTVAKNDTIAWAVRKNADNLKTELNRFLYNHFRFGKEGEPPKRSTFLNVLRKRYFKSGPQIADYYNPESNSDKAGGISPYDDIIKQVSDSAGVNWLLVASIIAQETKFNPNSKSWAGAIGLMQVLPRFSNVSDDSLYNIRTNIKEGIRIIKKHLHHYSYMDSTDQWSFALAAYNAGAGHIADARRLVIDENKNPNKWENASDALLKLMHRKYYKDARYGFCRGIETVRYVQQIKNRYKTYKSILAMNKSDKRGQAPGVLGMFNLP